jgi:prophage regulatory protein
MQTTILRLPDVKKRTGLSKSSIYLKIQQGDFPRPIALGIKAVGWLEQEIQTWLEQQIALSRQAK